MPTPARPAALGKSLLESLQRGEATAAITFAGQGVGWLEGLAALDQHLPTVRAMVDAADAELQALVKTQPFAWSGLCAHGFELARWLRQPDARPPAQVLSSSVVSQPGILLAQAARWQWLHAEGFGDAVAAGAVRAATGHSQGVMAALLVSEAGANPLAAERCAQFAGVMAWQGLTMAQSAGQRGIRQGEATAMAAVSGPTVAELQTLVDRSSPLATGADKPVISLWNTRTRHVISAAPAALLALRTVLESETARQKIARKEGRLGGKPLAFTWEWLDVGAPFHGPAMQVGLAAMRHELGKAQFGLSPLHFAVLSSFTGQPYAQSTALAEVMADEFVRPVRWHQVVRSLAQLADNVLDLGPSDGVAKLTMSALRGTSTRVVAVDLPHGQRQLLDGAGPGPLPLDYRQFAPTLVELPDGEVVISNRFSQATAQPPVILPGMTPTTADAPIVAAAANAGYWSELAGGGQPTARTFELRMEELAQTLLPGRGVVLNALYLDPYLWDLQIGKGLAVRARHKGLPLHGITVSAGIPPVDEAVRWVNQWRAAGIAHIAFKPGTAQQIEHVCKIAKALPRVTLHVHVEGGKAGGHHSWEDLDALLLDGYAKLRDCPNLIVCVGGGIAHEQRAVELLTGTWSRRYQVSDMPVDAVFLGTLAMACLEATATSDVKRALVQAAGTPQWVYAGQASGQVTSGKSQLGADIHYLDNAASRVGRLLDAVAGDEAAVTAQRAAIISALATTAKPYFGDVGEMTWFQLLARAIQLLAVGTFGRYDDGAWLDPSWRSRGLVLFARAEARLAGMAAAQPRQKWLMAAELDDPQAALHDLSRQWPQAATELVHPSDVPFFVDVCGRPGKPVPFVPVIDADVRRWYKADALWQAQDPRYPANAVLVIPGPEAVTGIERADEPVAELLGRFERAVIEHLRLAGARPVAQERLQLPKPTDELSMIAADYQGPVAAACADLPWQLDDKPIVHLLRALCPPGAGTFSLPTTAGGQLTALCWTALDGEAVTATQTGPHQLEIRVGLAHSPRQPDFVFAVEHVRQARGAQWLRLQSAPWSNAVQTLYQGLIADDGAQAVPLFAVAHDTVQLDAARLSGWAALTGGDPQVTEMALDFAFPLIWRGLFRAMGCAPLRGGWLRLLHARHRVQVVGRGRPLAGADIATAVRVVRVEDSDVGRTVELVADVVQGEAHLKVTTTLLIRGSGLALAVDWTRLPVDAVIVTLADQPWTAEIEVADQPAADFLNDCTMIQVQSPIAANQTLQLRGNLREIRLQNGQLWYSGAGEIDAIGLRVGRFELVGSWQSTGQHPLRALTELVAAPVPERPTPPRLMAEIGAPAPLDSLPFAAVGGDFNPLHHSPAVARLAGLPAPIVHGMWTAARLSQFVCSSVGVTETQLVRTEAQFLAPVPHGSTLRLRCERVGMSQGRRIVQATASVSGSHGDELAASARYVVEPKSTVYVFPGQGVQQQGMGMAGFARSKAARAVWERADAFTRRSLGFSVLEVVRANPKVLTANGVRYLHPEGVLQLTQFTQVSMAVLAMAQVAEMRQAQVLSPTAATCGHSVGEYNALAAYTEVLPLETVVDIVWLRGCTMHTVVERDAHGRSAFAMGVVRPNLAGLDHAGAEQLVDEIGARTGKFIQIVNHNVRDRQYSVTGEVAALAALESELRRRSPKGGKPAWLPVIGLDVPFHSKVLHGAVPAFRQVLDERMPARIDPSRLVGRYVPNLVARPFALDAEFIGLVAQAAHSAQLAAVGNDRPAWHGREAELTRLLLIELLAWQFASPVRWIETQELLFAPRNAGGMGVQRLIEIGPGHQPTLANMARASMQGLGLSETAVQVLNLEADMDEVLEQDEGVEPAPAPVPPSGAVSQAVPVPASVPACAPVAAPQLIAAPAGTVAPVKPIGVVDALRALVALQARIRLDQVAQSESLEDVFEGVSSRRNQALADLGAEFGVGAIDGAADLPLTKVADEIAKRNPNYRAPGKYLKAAMDDALGKLLGRAGLAKRDAVAWLDSQWGLNEATADHVLLTATLASRTGDSVRGGAVGGLQGAATAAAAHELLDGVAQQWAVDRTLALAPRASGPASGGAVVDSAALTQLQERIVGKTGVLATAARQVLETLGHSPGVTAAGDPHSEPASVAAATLLAELGPQFSQLVAPAFEPNKHAVFASAWASAQRQLVQLWFNLANQRTDVATSQPLARRLAAFAGDARIADSARFFASQASKLGHADAAKLLAKIAIVQPMPPCTVAATRPSTTVDDQGQIQALEVADPTRALPPVDLDLTGTTALVTGASPGSIALQVVRHLLWSGAKVVVTTSSFDDSRLLFYRQFYQDNAAPTAELHVVPYNAASAQDTRALVEWLFGPSGLVPDLCLPFAALKDVGTLNALSDRAEAVSRAMLVNVQRLVADLGARTAKRSDLGRPCHIVLPLSPNHGQFGGDGLYAQTKLGLETLFLRWRSEAGAWGNGCTLAAVRIGWVRGTGLMDTHDAVAAGLEQATGIQTFSPAQMGAHIAQACSQSARAQALAAPLDIDLTGGFGKIGNVGAVVDGVRQQLAEQVASARRRRELAVGFAAKTGQTPVQAVVATALAAWPLATAAAGTPADHGATSAPKPLIALDKMVVIVGLGELNPCGSARTRFAVEGWDHPEPAAIAELAWLCGLVRWQTTHGGGWVDVASGQEVADAELAENYLAQLRQRIGVRPVNPATAGFDPRALTSSTVVFLDRDVQFEVATHAEALAVQAADPTMTLLTPTADGNWTITRKKGAEIRVPKTLALSRHVAGLLPDGFDFAQFGIPRDMLGTTDPVTLMNLVATADAFASAGLQPEELLTHVHPARIGNTQGSGIGGMKSLNRLYLDPILGNERQGDALQETLINVMGAYAVQAYVGSYGAMAHPVAACATAGVSVEQAVDKLLLNRCDFVVAGGFDDYGPQGAVGFTDMAATADSVQMAAAGIAPHRMSRPNDVRRKGFVEAQGGGTFLLTRGDIALKLGLPVYAVVGYAASHADGIHRSIPAPGQGVLAVAMGGAQSPLGQALVGHGLTADDIAIVSKHDTSTGANDPNESRVHDRIQRALGRTAGNPLLVVSQKALTGHSKGGAAAWQLGGLCQMLASGRIAGNRNLDSVDPALRGHHHLCWSDQPLQAGPALPLRAGLVTSLGFGHVGALVLLIAPSTFEAALTAEQRQGWQLRSAQRVQAGRRRLAHMWMGGKPVFERRSHRRFAGLDGTEAQLDQEADLLTDADARLGSDGRYRSTEGQS